MAGSYIPHDESIRQVNDDCIRLSFGDRTSQVTTTVRAQYSFAVDNTSRRLEALRLARGWSMREFSRRAGMDETYLQKIQKRGMGKASNDVIRAFAVAGGVSEIWLLTGEGPNPLDSDSSEQTNEHRATDGVDEPPREPESPSTFGGYPNYAKIEKAARSLAPEIPDWAWEKVRNAHPLWVGKDAPGAQVIADVAKLFMKHKAP